MAASSESRWSISFFSWSESPASTLCVSACFDSISFSCFCCVAERLSSCAFCSCSVSRWLTSSAFRSLTSLIILLSDSLILSM